MKEREPVPDQVNTFMACYCCCCLKNAPMKKENVSVILRATLNDSIFFEYTSENVKEAESLLLS